MMLSYRETVKSFARASPCIVKWPEHKITPLIGYDLIVACRRLEHFARGEGFSASVSP